MDLSQDGVQTSHLHLHGPRCNVNNVSEIHTFSYSYEPGSVKYFVSSGADSYHTVIWNIHIHVLYVWERVQTVTKATKESSMLLWPSTVMDLEVTCQAKTVLPLHTAKQRMANGTWQTDSLVPRLLPSFCCWYIVSCEWCGDGKGIERVSLCVGINWSSEY